jgi:hypothetical protein
MEECRRTVLTKQVQVYTSIYMYVLVCTPLSMYTFEELNLPIKGPMEDMGVVKLYYLPQPSVCTLLQLRTWWVEPPLCH